MQLESRSLRAHPFILPGSGCPGGGPFLQEPATSATRVAFVAGPPVHSAWIWLSWRRPVPPGARDECNSSPLVAGPPVHSAWAQLSWRRPVPPGLIRPSGAQLAGPSTAGRLAVKDHQPIHTTEDCADAQVLPSRLALNVCVASSRPLSWMPAAATEDGVDAPSWGFEASAGARAGVVFAQVWTIAVGQCDDAAS